jgi:hypothetical protein
MTYTEEQGRENDSTARGQTCSPASKNNQFIAPDATHTLHTATGPTSRGR